MFNSILSLFFWGNRAPYTGFKQRWKATLCMLDDYTQLLLCAAHKGRGDDTFVKASVYVRLQKPSIFFHALIMKKKRKYRSSDLLLLCLRVLCWSHCQSSSACNYSGAIVSHWKDSIAVTETSEMSQYNGEKRGCFGLSRDVSIYSLITWHFPCTKLYSCRRSTNTYRSLKGQFVITSHMLPKNRGQYFILSQYFILCPSEQTSLAVSWQPVFTCCFSMYERCRERASTEKWKLYFVSKRV